MDRIDLDELERLAAQATPVPWEVDDCNNIRIVPKGRPIVATIHDYDDYLPRMADAAYIVAACNAVPELIAENRDLQERVRKLELQQNYIAEYAARGCVEFSRHWHTGYCDDCPHGEPFRCERIYKDDWITAAENRSALDEAKRQEPKAHELERLSLILAEWNSYHNLCPFPIDHKCRFKNADSCNGASPAQSRHCWIRAAQKEDEQRQK